MEWGKIQQEIKTTYNYMEDDIKIVIEVPQKSPQDTIHIEEINSIMINELLLQLNK